MRHVRYGVQLKLRNGNPGRFLEAESEYLQHDKPQGQKQLTRLLNGEVITI